MPLLRSAPFLCSASSTMSGVDDSNNVGIAMALVAGAGGATALGASVVFFPRLVKLASRRVLASALGLSAGVMTYVSFVEIFQKSLKSFIKAGYSSGDSYLYATLCFFGGVTFMLLVDVVIKVIANGSFHHSHEHDHDHGIQVVEEGKEGQDEKPIQCMCCSDDPVRDLENLQHQADDIIAHPHDHGSHDHHGWIHEEQSEENSKSGIDKAVEENGNGGNDEHDGDEIIKHSDEQSKLVRMGINTAIAIGLHNFPEGLATFVAALDNPKVGAVLAIAIGIHNIPEGLCVALPIYYATGNRWKAFGWACVSGASEPLAALLGWAVLANSFSNEMFAILFGIVGGMMVIISTRELLPTAHRYDPDDTVVTFSFIGGMFIMALSLVLFVI